MRKSLAGVFAPLLITAVLTASHPAAAKPPVAPAPPAARKPRPNRMAMMTAALNLTPAQQVRIKAILDSAAAQTKAIRAKTNASIEAVLTPAQKTTFAAAMHHGRKKP